MRFPSRTQRPKTGRALLFIYLTLLIDVIGLGIIYPVLPRMIQHLVGGELSLSSHYGGWLMFLYALMQFFFSPIFGAISDQYGRRPIILSSLFGFGIDYLFLGFAPTIGWLFLGRTISGITGASFTAANAYIADVSTDKNRTQNFGTASAMFGLGFIIGPALGGLLAHYGDRVPFFFSAGLALSNALFGLLVLPESLSAQYRRPFEWSRANPFKSLLKLREYPLIFSLIAALFCLYFADNATQSSWTYYTMEKFGWGAQLVGYSLGTIGLMIVIVQGGLIRFITPRLGLKGSIYYGLGLYSIGFLCFALASRGWMMFLFIIPFALGGIAGPAMKGLISAEFPPSEQGELQGSLNSILSISTILGPVVMTNLFSCFTKKGSGYYFPGAPFIAGFFLLLLALWFSANHFNRPKIKAPE